MMKRALLFTSVLLVGSAAAQAALSVDFRLNGAPVDFGFGTQLTIADNVAPDTSPTPGIISFQYLAPGGASLSVVISQSNAPGDPGLAILEINPLIINSSAAALTVDLETRDTAFTLPGAAGQQLLLDSRVAGTFTTAIGGTASFASFASPILVTTPTLNFTATTALATFDLANSALFDRTGALFTLSNVLQITVPAQGQANISGTSTVIPEPAALGLLAPAMLLLARRRR